MKDRKTITIDIDGVLNNYPFCWLNFIELHERKKFQTIQDAKTQLGLEHYSVIKEKYRTSGFKSKLPINPVAPSFTKKLKEKGYYIIIATSRPFHLYPHLEKLTSDWLIANQITFDTLERKSEKLLTKYPAISIHIDDELDHTFFFLEKGIDVYIIRRKDLNYDGFEQHKSLKFVNDLNDILKLIG